MTIVSRGFTKSHTHYSNNPFMTTSSSVVGINLNLPTTFQAPKLSNNVSTSILNSTSIPNFMYQTSSQAQSVALETMNQSKLSQRMDKFAITKEIKDKGLVNIEQVDVIQPQDMVINPADIIPTNADIKAISVAPKEHPLYATSAREIGVEKECISTEMVRKGRPNSFTASFNGIRYRDYGLNTSITKSRISDQLDI